MLSKQQTWNWKIPMPNTRMRRHLVAKRIPTGLVEKTHMRSHPTFHAVKGFLLIALRTSLIQRTSPRKVTAGKMKTFLHSTIRRYDRRSTTR